MPVVGVASYLLQVVGVRGAVGATAKFTRATTSAAGAATKNLAKTTQAVGKGTSVFGGLQNVLGQVKDNLLPLWAGLELVQKAVNTILGPSQVFADLMQTIQDVWGALIDTIIASFEPVWGPLLEIFTELVTEILPEIRPFLEGIAEVLRDIVVPIFREYRDELKLLLEGFVVLTGLAIAAFFLAVGGAVAVTGEAVRHLRDGLEGIIGGFRWLIENVPGLADAVSKLAQGFVAIADAVESLVGWTRELVDNIEELNRLMGQPAGGGAAPALPLPGSPGGAPYDPVGDFWRWLTGGGPQDWWGLQAGGIAMRPTPAIIGEAGPEAVIPLRDLRGGGLSGPTYVTNYFDVRVGSAQVPADEKDLEDLFERLGEMAGERHLAVVRRRT